MSRETTSLCEVHEENVKQVGSFESFWIHGFSTNKRSDFIRVCAIRCVLVSVCLFVTKILQLTQVRFSGLRRDSSGLYLAVGSLYDKSWGSSY